MLVENKCEISDLILARVAVNQVSMLDKFIFNESKALLEQIEQLEVNIKVMRNLVMDTLYSIVPQIDDKKISGKLIRLRRNLYNNKIYNLQATAALIELIPPGINIEVLWQWIAKERKLDQEMARLRELYRQEVEKNEEELWKLFKEDESEFIRGIPIVNSGFSAFMKSREKKHYKLDSNYFKSIYSYFIRSITKTSPISTFTQLSLSGFEETSNQDFQVDGIYMRWLRGLVTDLFESLSVSHNFLHFFSFKITDYIEGEENLKRIYFRGNYSAVNDIFSKTEDVFTYNEYLKILQCLPQNSFSYTKLIEKIDHPHPDLIAKFLIKQKLIRPVMPCSISENMPFKAIVDTMKKSSHYNPKIHDALSEKLIYLDEMKEELKFITSKKKRDSFIGTIKHEIEKIFQLIDTPLPFWIKTNELIYEDTRFNSEVPQLGGNVKKDLVDLYEYIQPFTYKHALYEKLMDKFKVSYGENGRVNVLEFLCKVTESETDYSKLLKAAREDDIQNVTMGRNHYEDNRKQKSATIYYQLVSNSHEELLNGDYLIVVNKVTDGSGSIFSRFNPIFDESRYKEKIINWISQLNPDQQVFEFSVGGDWANVQEKFNILPNQLNWIGELPTDEGSSNLNVTDLTLSIKEGKFVLTDQDNREVKPVYLGSVPEHLSADLSKLFLTIIKPWYIRTPYGSNPLNKPQVSSNITHFPRFQRGKIVLERAKWVIKLEELQELFDSFRDSELLIELNRWRRKNEIPEEVFFTLESNSMLGISKPMWFHFLSLSSIYQLKRMINVKHKEIILVESLPSMHSQWYGLKGEKFVTEFMSLLSI